MPPIVLDLDRFNADCEKTIANIQQISSARIAYLRALKLFLSNASASEVGAYLHETLTPDSDRSKLLQSVAASNNDFLKEGTFTQISQIAVNSFTTTIETYEAINKLISSKPHDQKLLDECHFIIHKKLEIEKSDKTLLHDKEDIQKKHQKSLLERQFLTNMLNDLEPLISQAEYSFFDEHEVFDESRRNESAFNLLQSGMSISEAYNSLFAEPTIIIKPKEQQKRFLLAKASLLIDTMSHLKSKISDEFKEGEVAERATFIGEEIQRETDRLSGEIKKFKANNTLEPQNIWNNYRELHETYLDAKETNRGLEDEVRLLEKQQQNADQKNKAPKQQPKKKSGRKNKPTSNKTNATKANATKETSLEPSQSVPEPDTIEAQPASLQIADAKSLYQEETRQYKEKIKHAREEKERLKQEKNSKKLATFEHRKVDERKVFAEKEKHDRENAFQMLSSLNPGNLKLIKHMFKKPTPHNDIRYQEIESLFGAEVEGKLPGTITSVSGSHRKICLFPPQRKQGQAYLEEQQQPLQQVIGFFDEISFENESEVAASTNSPKEIVGGMFKAHKKGHTGRLPSIAVNMVCGTLEKAGISAENVELFITSTAAMKASGQTEYGWKELLEKANEINSLRTATNNANNNNALVSVAKQL